MNDALTLGRRFSVAPMMDWSDRYCRFLHRQLSRHALLFTEMVTSAAIMHGDTESLLGFDPVEQPVAVQLGGSDPAELAKATAIASALGYAEINLNVGCPSDRVHRRHARLPLPTMINGGIETLDQAETELTHMDGVMLGRAPYHNPMLLADVDARIFGATTAPVTLDAIMHIMADYAAREMARGTRVNQITRHMLGLANGLPGARQFRQILSVEACRPGAGPEVIERALDAVLRQSVSSSELLVTA